MEISEEWQIGKHYCAGKSLECYSTMDTSDVNLQKKGCVIQSVCSLMYCSQTHCLNGHKLRSSRERQEHGQGTEHPCPLPHVVPILTGFLSLLKERLVVMRVLRAAKCIEPPSSTGKYSLPHNDQPGRSVQPSNASAPLALWSCLRFTPFPASVAPPVTSLP